MNRWAATIKFLRGGEREYAVEVASESHIAVQQTCHHILVAVYTINKWVKRAEDSGYGVAAAAMRKQGIPLETALLILFNRKVR